MKNNKLKIFNLILLSLILISIGLYIKYTKNQYRQFGTIEGSLSYPGSEIPTDILICAENILTREENCTTNHIKNKNYKYGVGYKLNVPVGSYYVFAKSKFLYESILKESKAYYSEFVTCGMQKNCISHEPIKVYIKDGETIKNIDPMDWYNQKY